MFKYSKQQVLIDVFSSNPGTWLCSFQYNWIVFPLENGRNLHILNLFRESQMTTDNSLLALKLVKYFLHIAVWETGISTITEDMSVNASTLHCFIHGL